jgi:DNA-binding transcriptional LysR family regulator
MDLRRLEHFLAVIEYCSFGKAAKQLKITQSGLTKSIQALEESVGTLLFIRHSRGVKPTKYGESLSRHAALILAQSANALDEIGALKVGRAGKLEIGIAPAWMMGDQLSKVISEMAKNQPGLNLRIFSQVSSRQLFERLLKGELDIVIGTEQYGSKHPDCEFTHLVENVHGVIVRAKHPILKKKKIMISDFDEYGWVMREQKTFYHQHFESIYVEANKPIPQPIVETNSIPLIIATVANTDYLGAARRADIKALGQTDVVLLEEPFRWKRNVSIMRRRDEPLSGAGQSFIDALLANFSRP